MSFRKFMRAYSVFPAHTGFVAWLSLSVPFQNTSILYFSNNSLYFQLFVVQVGLCVTADSDTLLVYLGPHIYVDLQNTRINEGDEVEITEVRTLLDGSPALLAGEVRKGEEVPRLRDDKGVPLWGGRRQTGSR